FELIDHPTVIEDWVQDGLFRPIVVKDRYLSTIWEGFVDSITINHAGLSITHGPVTTIANRVFAIYSGVDTSVYPPQIGVRKKTPTFNNSASQAEWGIWPEILSLAGVSDANADQLVEFYLQEHGNPEINSNFAFGNQEISLSVHCIGWYHTLKYPFNYTTNSGTVTISERIAQILAANPNNSWISSDLTRIANNTTAVPQFEDDDQLALEHLRGLTAMGDGNFVRYPFGIYEDRHAVSQPASEEIDYATELADTLQQIFDNAGAAVPP